MTIGEKKGSDIITPQSNYPSTGESSTTSQRYENYVPIDYIKAEIIGFQNVSIYENSILDFGGFHSAKNQEYVPAFTPKGKRKELSFIAYYKNLVFKYYPNSDRMILSGSLHTFWNNGEHNHNDFSIIDFLKAVDELESLFGLRPINLRILQIEFGVNVLPPIQSNLIIDHCLFHKWVKFTSNIDNFEGKYKQSKLHDYIIKLYNKALQNGLNQEILRFERKQIKYGKYVKKIGIGQTLYDLMKSDFKGFKTTLLNDWGNVLMFDPLIDSNDLKITQYRDPITWMRFNEKSRTTRLKHVKKLKEINCQLGGQIQNKIQELIESKIEDLNNQKVTFSPFSYSGKTLTPNKSNSNLDLKTRYRIIYDHYGLENLAV